MVWQLTIKTTAALLTYRYFSMFQGLPTHDVAGKELSKSLVKKLQKMQLQQEKKYAEYLKSAGES